MTKGKLDEAMLGATEVFVKADTLRAADLTPEQKLISEAETLIRPTVNMSAELLGPAPTVAALVSGLAAFMGKWPRWMDREGAGRLRQIIVAAMDDAISRGGDISRVTDSAAGVVTTPGEQK